MSYLVNESEEEKNRVCEQWCKEHHSILSKVSEYGFYYMTRFGEDWYCPFDEM